MASPRRAASLQIDVEYASATDPSHANDVEAELERQAEVVLAMCDGHDGLPNWLLKQCDPNVVAMVKDFVSHEHLLGTALESTVLERKMHALQNTEWRDGSPIGLWTDNASELKHFLSADPAEMIKIMRMYIEDAPMHLRHYLEVREQDRDRFAGR